ncbi:MAG: sugar ABC transporter permease [Ruminococcaceae bacterium]|nr:sugar ABC transporter permease [Oscillospiraceae bacterium]
MSDSNFNQNEELNEIKDEATEVAENVAEATEQVADAAEVAEETVENTAEEVAEVAEEVAEAAEEAAEPAKKKAVHMTASAASLNAEGEEVDIRRRQPKKEVKIKKTRISYERKKGLYGYGFVAIWIVGVIYMFIIPLIQSAWYSLCKTDLVTDMAMAQEYGMSSVGIYTEWNNFNNYHEALLRNTKFLPALTESLGNMLMQVPMVMIFSLFIALLLNQKFRGRTLARAVFFLPVLVATGPVIAVIRGDISTNGVSGAEQFSSLFQTDLVDELLSFLGLYNLSEELTTTIETITSDIFNLIWAAGIQILIFLAALQQIPTSAKEAASMEGATGWEFFWKITFPMISPMILANLIYTVIDTFVDSENPVMEIVITQSRELNYGLSAAMAWIYFAIVAVALGIIVLIVSKFVFYEND